MSMKIYIGSQFCLGNITSALHFHFAFLAFATTIRKKKVSINFFLFFSAYISICLLYGWNCNVKRIKHNILLFFFALFFFNQEFIFCLVNCQTKSNKKKRESFHPFKGFSFFDRIHFEQHKTVNHAIRQYTTILSFNSVTNSQIAILIFLLFFMCACSLLWHNLQ